MATTYTLISSNVLTTTTTNVVFNSLPTTYTDLLVKVSVRSIFAGADFLKMNVSPATAYSNTLLLGNGSTASSSRNTGQGYLRVGYISNANDTSNTFSNGEIYIPNYRSTVDKPISSVGFSENNGTTAYIAAYANLLQTNDVINSLTFAAANDDMAAGTSFYLYGISNA